MSVVNTISPEIDKDENGFVIRETYVTNGGLKLSIEPQASGLYAVVPNGGGTPPEVCGSLYTSHLKARQDLIKYLMETDRLGYAEYPGKPEDQKRKAKFTKHGHRENNKTVSDVRERIDD